MRLLVLFLVLFFGLTSHSQESIEGDIRTSDTAELSILGIYPKEFPQISVVFRAEKNSGEPVFGLKLEDMQVTENNEDCEVISLCGLSEEKPISIGLVMDHSGSMLWDEVQMYELGIDPWFMILDDDGRPILPDEYHAPINIAKESVLKFANTFNFKKDQMSVVGFSTVVDKVLPLTSDRNKIDRMVQSMEADSLTAFYDAMIVGLDEIHGGMGLNVLVALTDGNDNSSEHSINEVVYHANELEIPLYVIGLGDVNRDSLQYLADKTKGQFYYASSAKALEEIYILISERLQAFYDLVYISPNLSSSDGTRDIHISFVHDKLELISEKEKMQLPDEIIEKIKHLEEEARQKQQQQLLLYGGIAAFVLLAGAISLIYLRKKRKRLEVKLYPNPSNGVINIKSEGTDLTMGELTILNSTGQQVFSTSISKYNRDIDLTQLGRGVYIAVIQFGSQKKDVKFVIS